MKILIADDSPTIRAGLTRLVEKMGHDVAVEILNRFQKIERVNISILKQVSPLCTGIRSQLVVERGASKG